MFTRFLLHVSLPSKISEASSRPNDVLDVTAPATSEPHLSFIYTPSVCSKSHLDLSNLNPSKQVDARHIPATHERTRYKSGGEKVEKPKLLIKTEIWHVY